MTEKQNFIARVLMMIFFGLVILTLITSCSPAMPEQIGLQKIETTEGLPSGVSRFIDREAGVVCWMVYRDGTTCLPLEETFLR